MFDKTPYDRDRAKFSREALARLVLSGRAAELAEEANNLVVTLFDRFTGPGGRSSEADRLRAMAEDLMTAAVIYERERGSSWQEIAQYLDMDSTEVDVRYTPAIDFWHKGFEQPDRLHESGRRREQQLPKEAYDPKRAIWQLDLHAHLYIDRIHKSPVGGGLDSQPDVVNDLVVEGEIERSGFVAFMDCLAYCVNRLGHEPVDWDDMIADLSSTVLIEVGELDVRVAAAADDRLSITIHSVSQQQWRIQAETLLLAFGRSPAQVAALRVSPTSRQQDDPVDQEQ